MSMLRACMCCVRRHTGPGVGGKTRADWQKDTGCMRQLAKLLRVFASLDKCTRLWGWSGGAFVCLTCAPISRARPA